MRLDLFLKACKLVKRRAIARQLCEAGRVMVNGHESKPSKAVKQGDILLLLFNSKNIELEVLCLPISCKKTDAALLYRVTAETKLTRNNNA